MDPSALASKLRRMHTWMEPGDQRSTGERHLFDRPPFGRAEVTVDTASTAPAASYNRNRIYLCGSEGGLARVGLEEMVGLFDAKQVGRSFVWLSPGPDMEPIREWLAALGFVKVPWTRYPTLMYGGEPAAQVRCEFAIREVGSDEVARARAELGEIMMEGFAESAGREGFHHYMAFDSGRPVAVAALVHFEDVGYLTWAATAETHQRRGAQGELIAHRVQRARALGCAQIVSQTLTMLAHSLANLQRAGFREVYEQEVYERIRP